VTGRGASAVAQLLSLKTGVLLLTIVLAGGWAFQRAQQRVTVERGDRLFHGDAPLVGRIVGHAMALPNSVTRCMNCHESRSSAVSAAASAVASQAPTTAGAVAGRFGPALDHDTLTQLRPRRGGPPSRYDAQALCTLLRTGVDPAQVMIPQTMPRYEIDGAGCEALWAYLHTLRSSGGRP
jgi:hypothetical protein